MSPTSAGQREHIRQLFAQESASRLDALAGRLLELEQLGDDAELLQEIFREAHTLKGSAAVVGFRNVAEVAHAVEDLLEELRGGRLRATPELVDGVLHVVDGLRSMIPRIMAGHDCAPEAADLVRGILALAGEATGATPADAGRAPTTVAPSATTAAAPAPRRERRSRPRPTRASRPSASWHSTPATATSRSS
jgi:two-component system chemotaxis sensor kinase CheA